MEVAIDVIVPTRNRPDDLRRMLPTVAAQSHRNFRLVVVDQSDDPGPNADAMREFADDRMLHLPRTQKGKSGALNYALSLTSHHHRVHRRRLHVAAGLVGAHPGIAGAASARGSSSETYSRSTVIPRNGSSRRSPSSASRSCADR